MKNYLTIKFPATFYKEIISLEDGDAEANRIMKYFEEFCTKQGLTPAVERDGALYPRDTLPFGNTINYRPPEPK